MTDRFNNPLVSIIIPTYNRPDVLKRCLKHIEKLTYQPYEVIVVDASSNDKSRIVVTGYAKVSYAKIDSSKRQLCRQRNIGIHKTKGEIVAFLDDDSLVYPDWLNEIISAYNFTDNVGGVGGRALRGEQIYWDGKTPIGRIKDDGFLTEGFDGDPSQIIEVDHLIGCNMSYRKDVLEEIGGFDERIGFEREETDIAIRVKKADYKILYNPKAVVNHLGALREGMKRFSLVCQYRMNRNHMYMLVKNYGIFHRVTIFYLFKSTLMDIYRCIGLIVKAIITLFLTTFAKITGTFSGIFYILKRKK